MEPGFVVSKISLGIRGEDRFLIISDRYCRKFGEEIKKFSDCEVLYIELEDYFQRPIRDYPDEIHRIVEDFSPTVSCFVAKSFEGEVKFRISLIRHLLRIGVRHAHMPGMDEVVWREGVGVDYNLVKEITVKVGGFIEGFREIEVYNKNGTEVYVEGGYKIVYDTGIYRRRGEWGNLPAGEVFTTPKKIEGKFVGEVLGDYFVKYGRLKHPVIFEIESSELVDVRCEDRRIEREIESYLFDGPENSTKVGEFAIGTNVFLKRIVGNLLQDEKFPGVHIAFGDPISESTGAPWSCDVHLDVISTKTDVIVDGRKIMEKGRFLI